MLHKGCTCYISDVLSKSEGMPQICFCISGCTGVLLVSHAPPETLVGCCLSMCGRKPVHAMKFAMADGLYQDGM